MKPHPDVGTSAELTMLESYLAMRPGWNKAEDICKSLGWSREEEPMTRKLRDLAQDNPRILSGDDGYMLMQHATVDDLRKCVTRQYAKIRSMARSIRLKIDGFHGLKPCGAVHDLLTVLDLSGLSGIYNSAIGQEEPPREIPPVAPATAQDVIAAFDKADWAAKAAGIPPPDDGFPHRDQREIENEGTP